MKAETKLPAAPEIVVERPTGMPFEEFKLRRKASNWLMRRRLREGFLVYKAQEYLDVPIGEPKEGEETPTTRMLQKYKPFVGDTHKLEVL